MAEDAKSTARMSSRERTIVALLVISVIINYVDRSNLSLAVPLIQRQFTLSPLQVGSLLSAFFWTYALMQISGIAGWLSDRLPVGWILVGGYVLWSGATVATGLVPSFSSLYAARLFLGVGESVAYPCYSRVFAELPQEHRGRANALIDAGTKLGPSIGALVGGLVLRGRWHYLEHDWVAEEGSYIFEPPGETHTLIVPDGVDEMMTWFHNTGGYTYVDPKEVPVGCEDVFTKIDAAKRHDSNRPRRRLRQSLYPIIKLMRRPWLRF